MRASARSLSDDDLVIRELGFVAGHKPSDTPGHAHFTMGVHKPHALPVKVRRALRGEDGVDVMRLRARIALRDACVCMADARTLARKHQCL